MKGVEGGIVFRALTEIRHRSIISPRFLERNSKQLTDIDLCRFSKRIDDFFVKIIVWADFDDYAGKGHESHCSDPWKGSQCPFQMPIRGLPQTCKMSLLSIR
jgi:hypothetical protein